MRKVKTSIVVTAYGGHLNLTRKCLESVFRNTKMDGVEIIVVANGCTLGEEEYVRVKQADYPLVLLSYPWGVGAGEAYNRGMKIAEGDYVVLLNNDVELLRDNWLSILIEPFSDPTMGITGPMLSYSPEVNDWFLIMFCCCIHRKVIDSIGYLDTKTYDFGGCEDVAYCLEAKRKGFKVIQVPDTKLTFDGKLNVGSFPIFHPGEGTMGDKSLGYGEKLNRNRQILMEKYHQGMIGKYTYVPNREKSRWEWAAKNIVGKSILDAGCGSGYGMRFIKNKNYKGIDKEASMIWYAKQQFGDYFEIADIKDLTGHYDTIVALEVMEHIPEGKEVAQKLKKYCDCLLISVPWNEPPGFWGPCHVLHQLTEKDFPGFEVNYLEEDGSLTDKPKDAMTTMVLKWRKSKKEEK